MKNETKATLSIFAIIIFLSSCFILFQYAKFMQEKFQSIRSSYHSGEKLYCLDGTNGKIISKQNGWEIIGERFVKGDLVVNISDCDKNSNTKN